MSVGLLELEPVRIDAARATHAQESPSLLIGTHEVCQLLGGISPKTLDNLRRAGKFPAPVGMLRHLQWKRCDVETFVNDAGCDMVRFKSLMAARERRK